MVQIVIDVQNEKADLVYEAFKHTFGSGAGNNPSSAQKKEFVRGELIRIIKKTVRDYQVYLAQQEPQIDNDVAT